MKILFTENPVLEMDGEALDILRKIGSVQIASDSTEATLANEAKDVDALVVRLAHVGARIIDGSANLKVIGRTGTGVDNVDVASATRRGICVVNVPSLNAPSVAEHSFGLILSLARCIKKFDLEVRRGNWASRDRLISLNSELSEKTLGILGFGAIGSRMAEIGRTFGMKILAFDPYVSEQSVQAKGATKVELKTLLSESDVITIHAQMTEKTRHMISENEFALMKRTALLINCSRGGIVDENALVDALAEKRIAGAGLDVFESEPLPLDNPFSRFDNVIVTPHVAGFTKEVRFKTMITLAQDIARALTGQVPRNLVNPDCLKQS